jgi:hypothetical protein
LYGIKKLQKRPRSKRALQPERERERERERVRHHHVAVCILPSWLESS